MADISKIETPDGTTYNIKDATARSKVNSAVLYQGGSTTDVEFSNPDETESWILPYTSKTAASSGTALSLVTTGEKYTWNNKSNLAIGTTSSTAAAGDHSHGYITNGGDITTNKTIASGDRLVINDETASKVKNSSITFGTSTTTYLRNDGKWGTPSTSGLGFTIKYGTTDQFSVSQSSTDTCEATYTGFANTPIVVGTMRGVSNTTNQLVMMITSRDSSKTIFTIRNNGTATRTGYVDWIAIGT